LLWEREEEGRADAEFGSEPDFAVVEFDDFFCQGQADVFAGIKLILHIILDAIFIIASLSFFSNLVIIGCVLCILYVGRRCCYYRSRGFVVGGFFWRFCEVFFDGPACIGIGDFTNILYYTF